MEFVQKSIFLELGEDEITRSLNFDAHGEKRSLVLENTGG
jgi:hypothetical protein